MLFDISNRTGSSSVLLSAPLSVSLALRLISNRLNWVDIAYAAAFRLLIVGGNCMLGMGWWTKPFFRGGKSLLPPYSGGYSLPYRIATVSVLPAAILGMGYDAATFFDQRNWKTLVTWISLILAPVCVWVALYLTREPIPLSVPRGGGDGSGVSGSGSSGNGCSGGDKYGDEGGTRSRVAAVVGKATKQSTQSYCTGVGHIVWLWNPLDSCTVLCMGAAAFWKFICTPEFMVATGFMTIEQGGAEEDVCFCVFSLCM